MGIREDIEKVQKKVEKMQEESFALNILNDYKKQNKRQFIVIMVIIFLWFLTGAYLVYLLNDTAIIEDTTNTIDIDNVDTIDSSHIKIGNDIWEKSE